MSHSLATQVILITGASTGIGAALARELAAQYSGIRLILTARSQERLEAVAADCRQARADVLVIPADITQPEQMNTVVTKAIDQFGRVDALVNNAGYGQMGPVELIPGSAIQQQLAVNLLGPIGLIQALIPIMRDQGGGRIINVSSLGGRIAFPFGGMYSMSKFALEGLSDALRMELDPFNIRVSVIEPGPVKTEFVEVAQRQIKQAIANPLETPYRAAFQKLESLEQQLSRQAWSAERVAQVIIKALSDRHPKPRYVAATGGNILISLMTKVLPTSIVDAFWQRFYGINLVAQDWKAKRQSSNLNQPPS